MYEKIKTTLTSYPRSYYVIGAVVLLSVFCLWYIFREPGGADYQRALNAVERAQEQQRESIEFNRSIQRSIDRSTELSHEAATRIERSKEYNQQIGERITNSQGKLSEARGYLIRNATLFNRVERESRERQENNQATTNATQPIPGSGSGSNNRSGNSSMTER